MAVKDAERVFRPPYVTYATWARVLDDVGERKPTRIDSSYYRELGLSDSTGVTVKAALSFLGLVDRDTIPTEKLLELASSEGDDRQRLIKHIVEESYTSIVGGIDLEHATMGHLLAAFADAGARGNVGQKCVTFFLALAKDAGMALSPGLLTRSRVGMPHRREAGPVGGSRGTAAAAARGRSPRRSGAAASHLASKLPAFDPGWPKEVRDEWMAHHLTLQATAAWMDKFPSLKDEWSDEFKARWLESWKEVLNKNLSPPAADWPLRQGPL
jgi:hypothetical protein